MRALVALAPLLLVTVSARAEAQLKLVPLDIRVPVAPTPWLADGRTHLAYELRVTNLGQREIGLEQLAVFADSAAIPLASRTADELRQAARMAGAPTENARLIPAGRQTLIYLWLTLPEGSPVPVRLRHRIALTVVDSGRTQADTVERYFVPVAAAAPLVLAPPFTAGPWVAVNGPSNTSGHRRTAVPLDGEARIGQRFATDWIKLGADGLAFRGDSLVNANWYGYGVPVIAVADAIVSAVTDGIIENVPFSPTMAVPITLETVGGNHVILELGQGRFAFYAHLVPGSIKVRVGDRVRRGQQLGALGNSGNSTAPHLHFHVTDGNSPLGSEGLPFVFDRFELLDWPKSSFESLLKGWRPPAAPVARRNEGTLENMIVRFR